MTEPNPYMLDEAGQALVNKHIAMTPEIRSNDECRHYAQELIRMSEGHTCATPVEARAMSIAVLARMLQYDGLVETLETMDAPSSQ